MIALLGPWTARNHARTGALIPTASWLGASLYDGLNPDADGSSNMRFLDDPWIRSLSEVEQDRYLTRSAWEFAVGNPARAAELAIKKAGRFWSPWPNAKELSRPGVALASSLITVPIYVFVGIGAWIKRREPARLWLLLGPLFTTAVLHMVFVGSIRYRIPVLIPALPLAAIGLASIWWRTSSGGESLSSRAEPLDLP